MATTALSTTPDQRRHRRQERFALPGGPGWWTFCAAASLALAALTSLGPHRVWGAAGALGYAAAAVLAARGRPARTVNAVAALGAVGLPLALLLALDRAQLEVAVVARSAALLLADGTPYSAHPLVPEDFTPYLPGMAAFGLPEAVAGAGPLTDPRLWMGAAFLAALAYALPAGARRDPLLWTAACPLVALPLAVGGVDLPVAGLMCLGLAEAGRGRAGRAGLWLGLAAALKWTAWPALPVALALLAAASVRERRGRAALRCALVALLTAAALVLPAALRDPGAFHAHVVAFPLGLTDAVSSAASPLPGRLLATHVPGGRTLALLLLGASALLVALSLLVRPPATASDAALRLALGLLLAIAFLPATRLGYLVHPLVLAVWAGASRQRPADPLARALIRARVRVRKKAAR
ncbi:glycosyltransferase 87 family protein [Streptomyces sp. NPDC007346]|uniref:glycosyltransferase 87 family protein n=1 Tax=Streptomyces sp. NPDC007346 TaxID=3154682 RepID=UPI0034559140